MRNCLCFQENQGVFLKAGTISMGDWPKGPIFYGFLAEIQRNLQKSKGISIISQEKRPRSLFSEGTISGWAQLIGPGSIRPVEKYNQLIEIPQNFIKLMIFLPWGKFVHQKTKTKTNLLKEKRSGILWGKITSLFSRKGERPHEKTWENHGFLQEIL